MLFIIRKCVLDRHMSVCVIQSSTRYSSHAHNLCSPCRCWITMYSTFSRSRRTDSVLCAISLICSNHRRRSGSRNSLSKPILRYLLMYETVSLRITKPGNTCYFEGDASASKSRQLFVKVEAHHVNTPCTIREYIVSFVHASLWFDVFYQNTLTQAMWHEWTPGGFFKSDDVSMSTCILCVVLSKSPSHFPELWNVWFVFFRAKPHPWSKRRTQALRTTRTLLRCFRHRIRNRPTNVEKSSTRQVYTIAYLAALTLPYSFCSTWSPPEIYG